MREDYTEKYKFDIIDEEPETSSRLVLWVWPVLGIFAIAAIVVTVLQSPWILDKVGLPAEAPMVIATKPVPPPVTRPVKPAKKATPEKNAKTKETAKPVVQDIAGLKIEISRLADTLKAINTTIKAQNSRLAKLESTVGTVTGSIPGPKSKAPSSSKSKTAKAKPENQVNTTQKADLLTSTVPAKERMGTSFAPVSSTTTHQDTGEARARPAPVTVAAINTTNVPRPAIQPEETEEPKQQYAIKLARARKISTLSREWKRLIRGKAAELSVLEPHVMPTTTSDGKKAFDLIAGPFTHMADAIELCARLKIEGIKCKQARYGGKPL